jgi:hypothetical protein
MDKLFWQLFFELYVFESNMENWEEEKFIDEPIKLYRLQMLQSLLRAFSIEININDFLKGIHINQVHVEKWSEFRQRKLSKVRSQLRSFETQENTSMQELQSIFQSAISYRMQAQLLFSNNDHIYAASGNFLFYLRAMNHINKKLNNELSMLNDYLIFCLNPNQLKLKKRELMKNYNFPKVNLLDLDLDAM